MKEKIGRINLPERVELKRSKFNPTDEYYYRLNKHSQGKDYAIMFGPPFTSGIPHMGTVFSVLVKDILASCQFNLGKKILLRPGFDCHGLPTEQYVIKQGYSRKDRITFWLQCHLISRKNLLTQVLFYRNYLGVLASWDSVYVTHDDRYVGFVQSKLLKLRDNGGWSNIEVDFCPKLKTVVPLSESKIRVTDRPEIYFLMNTNVSNWFVCVYTRTPWNIPVNNGIAFNKYLNYVLYEIDGRYLIAREDMSLGSFSRKLKEDELSSLKVMNPFSQIYHPLVHDEWVTSKGTGLVHLAGLYSIKDYGTSLKYNLPMTDICYGNDDWLSEWRLTCVNESDRKVVRYLKDRNLLLSCDWFKDKARIFERSGFESIRFVRRQYCLNTSSTNFKARMLLNIGKVKWINNNFRDYVTNLVLNYKDNWNLSRNRIYNTPISESGLIYKVKDRLEACSHQCDGLDVWFDSANSFLFCYDDSVDLSVEGIDQYKGYFLRSLQLHTALGKYPPAKRILHTGFVVDKYGYKLSKSKGNYQSVTTLLRDFNEDTLRIWAVRNKLHLNSKLDQSILKKCDTDYRSLTNYLRFILGYWERMRDISFKDISKLRDHHLWILHELKRCFLESWRCYVRHDPHEAFRLINDFLVNFSKYYLNSIKSKLYFRDWNNQEVHQILLVFKLSLNNVLVLLRPFVPNLVRSINQYCGMYRSIWDIKWHNYPCWEDRYNYYSRSLNLFKKLRGDYEVFIADRSEKIRMYQTVLYLQSKYESLSKGLNFFSYWTVKIHDSKSHRFEINSQRICSLCMRNDANINEDTCKECISFTQS